MGSEEPTQPLSSVDSAGRSSRSEDCIDVFLSPVELFERRAGDRVAPPFITLLVLAFVLYFVMLPANRIVMLASVSDNPQALEAMERFGTIMQIVGSIFVPVTYAAVVLWSAALLWMVGRAVDIRTTFSRTVLIATYAAFIMLLSQLVVGVLVLIHGEAGLEPARHLSTGVLRFTGDVGMDRAIVPLLQRVDIFAIWQAVIWGVGIHVIHRTRAIHAAAVAAVVWLLFAAPGVLLGLFGIATARG
jgi:hypothetical protein